MKRLALLSLFSILLSGSGLAQITSLSFTSAPGSWVGGGQDRLITPLDGHSFSVRRNRENGVSFAITDYRDFQSLDWWYLDFGSADGVALTPGLYSQATRFPFNQSHSPATNGLAFSGNGRGDNELLGSFRVLEATYFDDGAVNSFAAEFIQYDENVTEMWNEGLIRYNALEAVPVPESASLGLAGAACCGLAMALRRRQRLS